MQLASALRATCQEVHLAREDAALAVWKAERKRGRVIMHQKPALEPPAACGAARPQLNHHSGPSQKRSHWVRLLCDPCASAVRGSGDDHTWVGTRGISPAPLQIEVVDQHADVFVIFFWSEILALGVRVRGVSNAACVTGYRLRGNAAPSDSNLALNEQRISCVAGVPPRGARRIRL